MAEQFSDSPRLTPIVRRGRRFSPIWIVPVVAGLLGLWLAWKYYEERGPEITVHFETAEGVVAGKTAIMCRSVNVGTVGNISLTENLKGVLVTMQMTSEATRLLTKDAQIWVVRPRYGASGVSGLSTIVSGSYIELEPGLSKEPRREFIGLEQPPVTPKGVPGLHVTLLTDEAGGIAPGSPILYKGLGAGKIESRTFHPENGKVEFNAFIGAEYANLVRSNTKFWNVSGIDVQVGANGLHLHAGTLESLLLGGITFGQPTGAGSAPAVGDGAVFALYDSLEDTKKFVMKNSVPFLLLFTGSVRGLSEDAPVEFRGVRIGTVSGVSFRYLPNDAARRVPVLIQIDPGLITNLSSDSTEPAERFVEQAVVGGLRASLKTGSFLTGQLYVDLDFQKDAQPATVVELEGYRVIPTIGSGLSELQDKASALLDKLQALPLDETVRKATEALAAIKSTAEKLDQTVGGYGENGPLYQDISKTLHQLEETLRSVRTLTDTLERKPNSLIFGKPGRVAPPKGSPNQ
ncbi:MAG TPA: MlaD family protein [Chthoniobacterales bacterium]|nr:MlaD family protein [Chthoniobacterales bacterium]